MKAIIIGPQCSGKTTIARILQDYPLVAPVIDEDDEIKRRNSGSSSSDKTEWHYKWQKLRPEIQKDILEMDGVIFLTSFFDPQLIPLAKERGFKLFQLEARKEALEERNKERMRRGVDDASYGWALNLPYHQELKKKGLINVVVSTEKPPEEVCRLILVTLAAMRYSIGMFARSPTKLIHLR